MGILAYGQSEKGEFIRGYNTENPGSKIRMIAASDKNYKKDQDCGGDCSCAGGIVCTYAIITTVGPNGIAIEKRDLIFPIEANGMSDLDPRAVFKPSINRMVIENY